MPDTADVKDVRWSYRECLRIVGDSGKVEGKEEGRRICGHAMAIMEALEKYEAVPEKVKSRVSAMVERQITREMEGR